MKIVVAPDKFKGAMPADQVAAVIAKSLKKVIPDAEILSIPLADGGEGTVNALVTATNGSYEEAEVYAPRGGRTQAIFGILGCQSRAAHKTAVIEMSSAAGLAMLPLDQRNPHKTTTYGVGELIRNAIDRGCREIILGLGGSATNDGGAGMAQALGVRFYDRERREITEPMTGGLLGKVQSINTDQLVPALRQCHITVACDVSNPLLGSGGATYTYAPQKGADQPDLELLETGMENLASIIEQATGQTHRDTPGVGAAGGIGLSLLAFCKAELKPGIDIIMDYGKFHEKIGSADLIITGEGKIDHTTFQGKTIAGVLQAAAKFDIPVIALAGAIASDKIDQADTKLPALFSICPGPMSLDEAVARAEEFLAQTTRQLAKILYFDRKNGCL